MGSVVCAVDDSPEAAEALRVAARLSRDARLRLVVVHVERSARFGAAARSDAHRRGRRLLDRVLTQQALDPGVDKRVEVGAPASDLARVAAKEGAILIIVGSPSRHYWPRRQASQLTGDLAQTAGCPVVVVPPAVPR